VLGIFCHTSLHNITGHPGRWPTLKLNGVAQSFTLPVSVPNCCKPTHFFVLVLVLVVVLDLVFTKLVAARHAAQSLGHDHMSLREKDKCASHIPKSLWHWAMTPPLPDYT
jgi:hypothetical protein